MFRVEWRVIAEYSVTDDYYFEGVSVGVPEKKLETASRGVTIYND